MAVTPLHQYYVPSDFLVAVSASSLFQLVGRYFSLSRRGVLGDPTFTHYLSLHALLHRPRRVHLSLPIFDLDDVAFHLCDNVGISRP